MAERRPRGEGSVYRRGDGRVVVEYVDANGKRRYVSGRTKAEVGRTLRGLLADRDEGIAYDSENLTVGAYLARWLLATKGTVRKRTWERHERVVRLHLGPSLGATSLLGRLGAPQVQALYGRKLEGGLVAAHGGDRPRDAPQGARAGGTTSRRTSTRATRSRTGRTTRPWTR